MKLDWKAFSPDDVVKLLRLSELVANTSQEAPREPSETDKGEEPVTVEPGLGTAVDARILSRMESQGTKRRITVAKKGGQKKTHWKAKKRKKRIYQRWYMNRVYKEKTAPVRTKLAEEGDWYRLYRMEWTKRGFKVEVSEEEWNSVVDPILNPPEGEKVVPVVYRLNTTKPVALGNILIRNSDTKAIVFDGHDWQLRRLGVLVDE